MELFKNNETNLTAVRKSFFLLFFYFFTFLCSNYYLLKHFFIYFSIKTVTQIGRNYWIKNISQNKCSRLTDHVTLSSKSFYCFSSLPLRPLGKLSYRIIDSKVQQLDIVFWSIILSYLLRSNHSLGAFRNPLVGGIW